MFLSQMQSFIMRNLEYKKLPVLRESDADLQKVPRNVVQQVPDLRKFFVRAFEVKVHEIPDPVQLI